MLTLNVSTLSHLQLSQWQQLFDIIAIVSAGDAFSAGKAYEVCYFSFTMCFQDMLRLLNFIALDHGLAYS